MKKAFLFALSALLGLVLLFLVTRYAGWKEIGEVLAAFSGSAGLAVLGTTFLIWLVEIWRWKFIFKSRGEELPFFQLGQILAASYSVFYLFIPVSVFASEGFKIYALKKKFSVRWEKTIAVGLIERILKWSVMIVFLIPGALIFPLLAPVTGGYRIVSSLFVGLLSLGLIFFYYRSLKNKSFLEKFLKRFSVESGKIQKIEEEVFWFYNFRKPLIWQGLGLTFLKYLLILARIWLVLVFLKGIYFGVYLPLAIMFFVYLSYLLPLPANLGVLEASQLVAFGSLGLGEAAGISFSFVMRGAELIVSLVGLAFLFKLGISFLLAKIGRLRE